MKIIKGINRKWMKKNEVKGKVVHKVRTKPYRNDCLERKMM
jgi:hypothetical protein